jgi:hypothetical protein
MRSINSAPLIKLGPEFTNVDEYMERFAGGVPDIGKYSISSSLLLVVVVVFTL